MNKLQNLHKYPKRNSSPSPFNIKMIPSLHSNLNNNNNTSLNQNNIDYSYSNSSQSKENEEIRCANCLSYQRNLNEKNLIIRKLQNQLNKINPNSYNKIKEINIQLTKQINSYKQKIEYLKNEIENKNEELSLLRLNLDEKFNILMNQKAQMENELMKLKNNNILLNKANIQYQKANKSKENEIKLYKEKVQALLMQINIKNEDINKIKGEAKNIIGNLEKKYSGLSSNYNTLVLSSGNSKLIKNISGKAKTNIGSDISNNENENENENEEDELAEILLNTGKLALQKSKSQNINYDSGNEDNKEKKKMKKKEIAKTPKMSSTQSSWMVSPASREFLLFQKDCENMNDNLNNALLQNQNMNQRLIMKNEQLKKYIEENNILKNNYTEMVIK